MDAVFYLMDALWLFRGKSQEEIREISFEIGMMGRHGLDINDPQGDKCPADAAGWTRAPCAFLAGSLARERALAELRKAAGGDYMNLADPWLGKIKRG